MDLVQLFVLALLQGITEFLPISSSAHLVLVPLLTGWQDQGLAFDVAVHIGTLLAVIFYFYRDITAMIQAWLGAFFGRGMTPQARLAWQIILATLPVIVAGFLFKDLIELHLRSAWVIAAATIIFGLCLGAADFKGHKSRTEYSLGWLDALLIGISQALALIPGTSRSGITITAALALGLDRKSAARFSFLLSIPTISGAGALLMRDLLAQTAPVAWGSLSLAALISGVSAYFCIHFFLRLLEKIGMAPFVVYRLLLGLVLLFLFY